MNLQNLIHCYSTYAATLRHWQHSSCLHQKYTWYPNGAAYFTWFCAVLEILLPPRLQTKHIAFHTYHRPYPTPRTPPQITTADNTREQTTHYNLVSLLLGSAAISFTAPASEILLFPRLRPTSKPHTSIFHANHRPYLCPTSAINHLLLYFGVQYRHLLLLPVPLV